VCRNRDLKPANLMISGNLHADVEQLYLDSGVVKVADFGLSKSLVPVDRHGSMSMSLTQVGDRDREGRRGLSACMCVLGLLTAPWWLPGGTGGVCGTSWHVMVAGGLSWLQVPSNGCR
jgi:serine/threonine protein kinase